MGTNVRAAKTPFHKESTEKGFTLIEVMISILVLTVGLIALLAVFGIAVVNTQSAQEDMIAKQLASETMENIFTARNTDNLVWDDLQSAPNGVFVTGDSPILQAGLDGIIGTADDGPARTLDVADPDGVIRGKTLPLTNYKRSIQITDVAGSSTVRSINIVVTYTTPKSVIPKKYTLSGYISQYR